MKTQIREYEEKILSEIEHSRFFSVKRLRKIIELDSLIKAFNA